MNKSALTICNKLFVSNIKQIRPISTSAPCSLIQKYRKEKGLPLNPNSCGPLTDLPDYTYLDGRPTPLGMNQKRRMVKQQEIVQQIIKLSKEIDFAVERHAGQLRDEQMAKERIIANKLKPKGHLLPKDKQ